MLMILVCDGFYRPKLIIPAHGPPNYEPLRLLATYLDHRQARENQILAAIIKVYKLLFFI